MNVSLLFLFTLEQRKDARDYGSRAPVPIIIRLEQKVVFKSH